MAKWTGRRPKLSPGDAERLREMYATAGYTVSELGRFVGLHRNSIYRYIEEPENLTMPRTRPQPWK